MTCYPISDASLARLHAAGWSIGEVRVLAPHGLRWLVTGTNGENVLRAEATTQAEAWHRACGEAEAVGMPGR